MSKKTFEEILSDHAWCEHKAATNAITIVTNNPEYPDLVTDLLALAKEELEHFQMVHAIIRKRGLDFKREQKDKYVIELADYMKRSNNGSRVSALVERLLFSAMKSWPTHGLQIRTALFIKSHFGPRTLTRTGASYRLWRHR